MTATLDPRRASSAARLSAVVVLPTPPFACTNPTTRLILSTRDCDAGMVGQNVIFLLMRPWPSRGSCGLYAMTLDEFEDVLKQLTPGQGAHVPYDTYRALFPPGEPNATARARAYE